MRVVMERSGLSRQTIHFYLRKGLLPKPRRTSRTYAVYSQETIELLKIIKQCQAEQRLSLGEISRLFRLANYDPRQIRNEIERRKLSTHLAEQNAGVGSRVLAGNSAHIGSHALPPPEWIDSMRRRGILSPRGERYSQENTELVESVWELSEMGVSRSDLLEVVKRIEQLAHAELTAFRRTLDTKRHAKIDYSAAIRVLAALDTFAVLKRRDCFRNSFFRETYRSADAFVGPNHKRVVPSETFLVRMGLNREVDRLLGLLDRVQDDKRSLRDLARAYYMRSDWLDLYGVSEKILQTDPLDVRAIADQTRAMYYLGRIDEAVTLLEQRLQKRTEPLLKFRLGQCLVWQAQKRSLGDYLNAVIQKQLLTAEALHEVRDQPAVRRWIALDRALDNLSVSDPIRLNQPTIEELEALYLEYQSIPTKDLSALSKMGLAVGKMLAAYALYLVYSRCHHPKTEQLRRKIVQMDPHGILATRQPHWHGAHRRVIDRQQ